MEFRILGELEVEEGGRAVALGGARQRALLTNLLLHAGQVVSADRLIDDASAPIWAGIIALADQYAGGHLGFVNPAIYQIARSSHYHQAFHDIIAGNANTAEFPHGCASNPPR